MTAKSRIVIDGRYLGTHASGIGEYVRALVTRMPKLAPDLSFRIWVRNRADVPAEVRELVEVHQVKAPANGLSTLLRPARLDALTSRDLFHSTYNILGFGVPCRSIVTVHDVMWLTEPNGCQSSTWRSPIARVYFGSGIRHALRRAASILTVSAASARQIVKVEPLASGKVFVTPNACDECHQPCNSPALLRERITRMLGIRGNYLLLVGQNQPSKGHITALRAFAAANTRDLYLVFVQRRGVADGLLGLVQELGMAHRVRFLSEVPRLELVMLMQGAVALLQPSSDEGFGLPVLEAAACGCPVVASDLPVFREVLEDAALYAPSRDVSAWSKSIVAIAGDANLAHRLRSRGPERAARFTWDETAARTLQVYRNALEKF